MNTEPKTIRITVKYATTCACCAKKIAVGEIALYEPVRPGRYKAVLSHLVCTPVAFTKPRGSWRNTLPRDAVKVAEDKASYDNEYAVEAAG